MFMFANKNLVWNSWGIMSNIANFQQILFYLHQSKKERVKVRDKRVQTVQVKKTNRGINTPVVFYCP